MAPGHLSQIDHWHTSDPPDIYFTRDYFDVSASLEPDFAESVLLQWQDDTGVVYLPLLLRTISDELFLMPPTRMVMVALGLMGNLICQLFVAIWMIGLDSVVWCRRLSSFTRSLKTGPRLRACLELKKSVKQ